MTTIPILQLEEVVTPHVPMASKMVMKKVLIVEDPAQMLVRLLKEQIFPDQSPKTALWMQLLVIF